MNVISEKADDDQCLNKTTWAFSGNAEELGWRLTGKPTLMRWGQAVMFYNVNHQYPHASFHWHSLIEKQFTQQGPNELYNILEQAKQLTKDTQDEFQTNYGRKVFVEGKFHVTWDNHFSGNKIGQYTDKNGYGCTNTTCRDCHPIPPPPKTNQAKDSTLAVKQVQSMPTNKHYVHTLTSFQSTDMTNKKASTHLQKSNCFTHNRN